METSQTCDLNADPWERVVVIGTAQRGPNPAKHQWLLLPRKENAWHHLDAYHHRPAPRRPSAGAGSGSQPRCSAVGAVPMRRPRNRNGSVTLKGKCDFCCCQVYSWILAKQILAATWISIYPPAWQHLGIIASDCYISNTGSVYSVTWTSGGHNGINNPRNNIAKCHMP